MEKKDTIAFRENWIIYIHDLQNRICAALEKEDGAARFAEDEWVRAEGRGGGGKTRVIANGAVFEKGGVNTSVVYGHVTEKMRKYLKMEGSSWFACGLSLVIHPLNPFVPTVHANWRYFELYNENGLLSDRWFGGGADLTPYYLFEEDAIHFHRTWKNVMDPFGSGLYPKYKKWCDEYFTNTHRNNEMRGIGGVFYDNIHAKDNPEAEWLCNFQQENGNAFVQAYLPIVQKRKNLPYTEKQVAWQEIRRGRYVEFNLLHDRGTLFGLKTKGRRESILMSLPPRARWIYGYKPEKDSPEEDLQNACLHARNWLQIKENMEQLH